jgi:hypothetical protein
MSQSTFDKGPKFDTYKLALEVPKLIDLKTVWFKFFCCCKTNEYKAFVQTTQHAKPEIIKNLDIVKFIQRLRMHGVALKMLMNKDVRSVSGWFGYKRDLSYAGGEMAGTNARNQEEYWDLTENISLKGKRILEQIKVVI